MNEAFAQTLSALTLTVRLGLPFVVAAFAVGLVIAALQALLRLSEPSLSALPRAAVTLLVLGALAPWASGELVTYTRQLFLALPELVR